MLKKYDGCSGGMSRLWRMVFKRNPPWEGCCDIHDQYYAKGGSALQRLHADVSLQVCVSENGHKTMSWIMFFAVTLGGHPLLPFPWRWGFEKFPWPTSYEKQMLAIYEEERKAKSLGNYDIGDGTMINLDDVVNLEVTRKIKDRRNPITGLVEQDLTGVKFMTIYMKKGPDIIRYHNSGINIDMCVTDIARLKGWMP